jgi:hypothetical protein
MRRLMIVVAIAALAVLASAPANAGGWAVGTLDRIYEDLHVGETTAVGYTIRQHGQTLVDVDETAIRMWSETGEVLEFPGRSAGKVGSYVADVTVPSAGGWTWELEMGWFGPQPLGTITVLDVGMSVAPAAVPAASTSHDDSSPWRRVGLPVLAGVACALFVAQLLTLRRRDGAVATTR